MFKFWFSCGFEPLFGKTKAEIPHVEKIQKSIIKNKLRLLNEKLSTDGRAQLSTTGLLEPSVTAVLREVATKGYQVWKSNTSKTAGMDYWIETNNDCEYVNKYCTNITQELLNV